MLRLTLSLCGPVQVRIDGGELPGPPLGAKPLALLAFLAMERREHARDALTTLLWGEFPEAQARASLRQALAQLRRALGDALFVDHGIVRLDAHVEMDVAPLLDGWDGEPHAGLRVEPAQFLTALRVLRGGGFEDWAEGTRAVLRRRHAALLARATRDAAARLDWVAAARLADRWREADPLDADATQASMEAHHLAGEASEALAVYAAHRALLAAETGEAPGPALRSLAARISRTPGVPTPPLGVPAANGHGVQAPLVGRRREWEALTHAWQAARGGEERVVVISGELGAGKSRLVGDFTRRASADGATVLRGRARETSSGIPFSAAADLLRSAVDAPGFAAVDGEWLAEVARLVPELRAKLPGVPQAPRAAPADEWRLYEGVVQLLAALAAEHPLLVVLDDVQWCDAASATIVRTLVERAESLPVLWCVTLGTGIGERDGPGARLASALAALPHAAAVALSPLGGDDVHALLVAVGAADGDADVRTLASRLHALTGGLPAFALEAVRALRAAGMLVDDAHGWRPSAALAADADLTPVREAPAIVAAIRDRLQRLGDDMRAVLLTLTLAGDACTPALLSGVHGVSRLRAAAIGDALVERGLACEEEGAYRVATPLVAAVVRGRGSSARRQEVERALQAVRAGLPSLPAGAPDLPARRGTGEWRSSA